MTSPANINSPANIIPPASTTEPNSSDSLPELFNKYAVIFSEHFNTLRTLQRSAEDRSVSERTSMLISAANKAINAISNLASRVAEIIDTGREPTSEIKDEISAAKVTAFTAHSGMYRALGSETTYNKSQAGIKGKELADDVSRYLDFVEYHRAGT